MERDYLRVNPLENPRWITQSRFKAVSTSGGVSLWCCGCHEGVYGRCWGLSETFQREVRGIVPAPMGWGGGLWTARSLFMMGPRDRGRKRLSRVELLPGARFRIPVQNLAGARGSGLVGEISWLPDHPGDPQFFVLDPGISAPECHPRNFTPGRAGALRISSLSTTRGILEKKISIFSKQATWLLGSPIFRFLF